MPPTYVNPYRRPPAFRASRYPAPATSTAQDIASIGDTVTAFMKQRRQDQIANSLMQSDAFSAQLGIDGETDPKAGYGGADELDRRMRLMQLRNTLEQQHSSTDYKNTMIQRMINGHAPAAEPMVTTQDGRTITRSQANYELRAQPASGRGRAPEPMITTADGRTIPKSQADYELRAQRGPAVPKTPPDSFKKLDEDLQAATGKSLSDFATIPESEKHLDGDRFWTGGYETAEGPNQGKPKVGISMPAAAYKGFLSRYNAIQGGTPAAATPVVPDGTAPPSGASGRPAPASAVSPDPGLPAGDGTAPSPSLFPATATSAASIRADFRAGRLSQEEAAAKLQALGFQ